MELRQSAIFLCLYYLVNSVCGQSFNPVPRNERTRTGPSVVMPRSFSPNSVREAFRRAEEIMSQKRSSTSSRRRPMDASRDSASIRHNMFQKSKPRSFELGNTQEKFEEATRILLAEFNLTAEEIMSGLAESDLQSILQDKTVRDCQAMFNVTTCQRDDRYRTFDGTCNNLEHPMWGMAVSCFERLLDPVYSDGTSAYRLAVSGRPLPNPRTISLEIHSHLDNPTEDVTHMFMQWGQFVDHDISLTPLSVDINNQPLNCCPDEEDNPTQCAAILVEDDDPFFSALGIDCLNNARSMPCPTCFPGARQQINQLTAFIDASQVYDTSVNDSRALRTMDGSGTMRTAQDSNSGELLPESADAANDACSAQDPELNCFQGGDPRVNQHPALTSFHTIFLREHNRIARRLRDLNRNWDDERLYQETRRIVGAEMQMITYNEFLPLALGPDRMQWFDLSIQRNGYTQYDPTVDPTLVNEFSTAAFRFGHSMINSFFSEMSRNSDSGNRLRDIFLYPFGLYSGQLDRITRGMTESPAQKYDRSMVRDVTDHLYQTGNQSGLDLASLNVMRGRDHGIPPYIDIVRFCGGPQIRSFQDLDRLFQRNTRQIFQSVYESVEDIDFFSGGLAERPNEGAVIGPTFTCVIGIQFYHLKYGDRFYFEHGGQAGSFTREQLEELRKITFAKIICDNTVINELQTNVMMFPNDIRNPVRPCRDIPGMNLTAWRA